MHRQLNGGLDSKANAKAQFPFLSVPFLTIAPSITSSFFVRAISVTCLIFGVETLFADGDPDVGGFAFRMSRC